MTVTGSYYTVDTTELANVRRFGQQQYAKPVGPGLHFKAPFIDQVDKLQVSQTALHIAPFVVTTVDNQKVTLDINFTYKIPAEKVDDLLYKIGRAGNSDIREQITAVAKDRAGRVMSSKNMTTVNLDRETIIQPAIEKAIFEAVHAQFGIEPVSLQISGIVPSDAFIASNEAAVKAKNDAIAAQNTLRTREFEAQQAVVNAKGKADSAIEAARGEAQATILQAEARKTAAELEGKGEKARLEAAMAPFGSDAAKYADYLRAKAYKGDVPTTVIGGNASTLFQVPGVK